MNTNNPQGNEKENINDLQKQSSASTEPATQGLFRLTGLQVANSISRYESVISHNHSALAPHKNDPSKKESSTSTTTSTAFFRKRLNSIDSSMLEDSAYKALDNTELILEKRIEIVENELNQLLEKIEVAKAINNEKELSELQSQKKDLDRTLENLKLDYKCQDFDSNMTTFFVKILSLPKEIRKEIKLRVKKFLSQSKLLRKFKPIFRMLLMRETLYKLNKINASIDELVKMKVPFGESQARQETLINHLVQAGNLHSQIMKEFKA